MAKYEKQFRGDFDKTLRYLHDGILSASSSASFEDESYIMFSGVRCCVRVYERYSWTGGNRVSMTVTLVGDGEELCLSAITAGGSQAMLFKMNTVGEEAFLDTLRELAEEYPGSRAGRTRASLWGTEARPGWIQRL